MARFHIIFDADADSAERIADTMSAFTSFTDFESCTEHRCLTVSTDNPRDRIAMISALWSHVDDPESEVVSFTELDAPDAPLHYRDLRDLDSSEFVRYYHSPADCSHNFSRAYARNPYSDAEMDAAEPCDCKPR